MELIGSMYEMLCMVSTIFYLCILNSTKCKTRIKHGLATRTLYKGIEFDISREGDKIIVG